MEVNPILLDAWHRNKICKVSPEVHFHPFKNILLDIGAGAKTSVGYGQLEEVVDPHSAEAGIRQMQREKREKEAERQEHLKKMLPVDRLFEKHYGDINTIINAMRKNQAGLNDSEKTVTIEGGRRYRPFVRRY